MNAQPRYAVQRIKPGARRRRVFVWVLLLLLALAVGAVGGYGWAHYHFPAAQGPRLVVTQVGDSVAQRKQAQKSANLQRGAQVAQVAAKDLRRTLADRDEEIEALRADLTFYARLVGAGERSEELAVHGVHLNAVADSHAWDVRIVLTQSARRGKVNKGSVALSVVGVRDGKLERLKWNQITSADDPDGLPYAFKYFQQLHATVVLPARFEPNRLRVTVDPDSGKTVTRRMAWTDAVDSVDTAEKTHVQQQETPNGQ